MKPSEWTKINHTFFSERSGYYWVKHTGADSVYVYYLANGDRVDHIAYYCKVTPPPLPEKKIEELKMTLNGTSANCSTFNDLYNKQVHIIRDKDKRIAELEKKIKELEAYIDDMESQAVLASGTRDRRIAELEKKIEELEKQFRSASLALDSAQERVKEVESHAQRITEKLHSATEIGRNRYREIERLKEELKSRVKP